MNTAIELKVTMETWKNKIKIRTKPRYQRYQRSKSIAKIKLHTCNFYRNNLALNIVYPLQNCISSYITILNSEGNFKKNFLLYPNLIAQLKNATPLFCMCVFTSFIIPHETG